MGTFLSYTKAAQQFTVSYPHYGLFRTADVRVVPSGSDNLFECKLLNGPVLLLKKVAGSRSWIDAREGSQTLLAALIGTYIDDVIGDMA